MLWTKKKKTKKNNIKGGAFVGNVMLSEAELNWQQFILDFKEDWGVDISASGSEEQFKQFPDLFMVEQDGMSLVLSLVRNPIVEPELMRYAEANFMWPEAADAVKAHQAQIVVGVLGGKRDIQSRAKLYTKAAASCLKQKFAIGLYTSGVVVQPEYYRESAMVLQTGELPLTNWIWLGRYRDEKQSGIYTCGFVKFEMYEMELYVENGKADMKELQDFMLKAVNYVFESGEELGDGETVTLPGDQKFTVTLSPGIASHMRTLKISCELNR